MDEDRLFTLEKEFQRYKSVLYSTAGCVCDLMRRIADENWILDEELEEKIAKIESQIKNQRSPK